MRFTWILSVFLAWVVAASTLPEVDDKEFAEMKDELHHFQKVIGSKDCKVAQKQLKILKRMFEDTAIHGHVQGQHDEVTYIHRHDARQIFHALKEAHEHAKHPRDLAKKPAKKTAPKGKGGRRKGVKVTKGGKNKVTKGGKTSGGRGKREEGNEMSNEMSDDMALIKLSCGKSKRILKTIHDFVPKIRVGKTYKKDLVFFIRRNDEDVLKKRILKSGIRRG